MELVHLEHGLARVAAIKETMGERQAIVQVGEHELWVPVRAWREHVRALPTRAEAEAWRERVRSTRGDGGTAAAIRRERTLKYRDFDRQLAALAEAYASGEPRGLDALEAHLLPVLAIALGSSPDALRAELRASMPAPVAAPASASVTELPVLGPGFEPLGTAYFGERAVVGDYADAELEILPGTWLGYQWILDRDHEDAQLVLIHADHIGQWLELVRAATPVATAVTDGAQALIYDPSLSDDPQAFDEISDPVEPGLLAGKGFSLSLGGDGDYEVRGTARDGRLVCMVTGNELGPLELRIFHGEDRERACLDLLAAWRADPTTDRDLYTDPVRAAVGMLPATEAGLAELARVFEVSRAIDKALAVAVATRLGLETADPMPCFRWLADDFERGPGGGYPHPQYPIEAILRSRNDAALTALVTEKLVAKVPAWTAAQQSIMCALAQGGHALPAQLLDSSPCARATSQRRVLERDPSSCERARDLISFVESYSALEREQQSYTPAEFDLLVAALRQHAAACADCRLDWVTVLFRIKRAPREQNEPGRICWLAPTELEALTGAATDDALWAWIGQHRS